MSRRKTNQILVVDDDSFMCEMVEVILSRAGYAVSVANSPSERAQCPRLRIEYARTFAIRARCRIAPQGAMRRAACFLMRKRGEIHGDSKTLRDVHARNATGKDHYTPGEFPGG